MWLLAPNGAPFVAIAPRDTCQVFQTPLAQTHTYSKLKSKGWRVLDSFGAKIPSIFTLTVVRDRFNSKSVP